MSEAMSDAIGDDAEVTGDDGRGVILEKG